MEAKWRWIWMWRDEGAASVIGQEPVDDSVDLAKAWVISGSGGGRGG